MQRFAMFQSSVALAVLALCGAEAVAAPNISRLTPPSNPALATATTLA
ncbi:MAG: hypothetical protein IIA03_08605, partial [Proteobacteria bacterium]|nr:hypothetical protein [Pseudomonadota bacterium]